MSEEKSEERSKEKMSLTSYDPVETPEEVINSDKDTKRREAFKEAYKRITTIIPEYFMSQRKKRRNATSGGGTSFSQNIVVTPDKVSVEEQKQSIKKKKKLRRKMKEKLESNILLVFSSC